MQNREPPKIGEAVTFVPASFVDENKNGANGRAPSFPIPRITGTVIQVHEEHRWYRVQFRSGWGTAFECFKF